MDHVYSHKLAGCSIATNASSYSLRLCSDMTYAINFQKLLGRACICEKKVFDSTSIWSHFISSDANKKHGQRLESSSIFGLFFVR